MVPFDHLVSIQMSQEKYHLDAESSICHSRRIESNVSWLEVMLLEECNIMRGSYACCTWSYAV